MHYHTVYGFWCSQYKPYCFTPKEGHINRPVCQLLVSEACAGRWSFVHYLWVFMGIEVWEMTAVSLHPGIDLALSPAPMTACSVLRVCVCIYRWGCWRDRRHLCQHSTAEMIWRWCPISRPTVHLKASADCTQHASSRWLLRVLLIYCIFCPLSCCGSCSQQHSHF